MNQSKALYKILVESDVDIIYKINPDWFINKIKYEIYKNVLCCFRDVKDISVESIKKYINNQDYKQIIKNNMFNVIDDIIKSDYIVMDTIVQDLKKDWESYLLVELNNKLVNKSITNELKINELKTYYDKLNENIENKELLNLQEIINNNFGKWESGEDTEFKKRSIDVSENKALKLMFGDFVRPIVTVIAGLPGFNKTSILLNIASYFDMLKKTGMLFSFEDHEEVWGNKIVAIKRDFPYQKLMDCKVTTSDLDDLQHSIKNTSKNNLWITSQSMNILDFVNFVHRQVRLRNYDYILIDYIELFLYNHRDEPRQLKIIMNTLRRVSIELKIPIIILSQLDKEKSTEESYTPQLKDLYGSSGLEKAARRIIMIGGVKNSSERVIYIRKSSYSAMYNFTIEINQASGRIMGVLNAG